MFNADIPDKDIDQALQAVSEKYKEDSFSFQIEHVGGGYQFLTKPAYQSSIGILLKQQSKIISDISFSFILNKIIFRCAVASLREISILL